MLENILMDSRLAGPRHKSKSSLQRVSITYTSWCVGEPSTGVELLSAAAAGQGLGLASEAPVVQIKTIRCYSFASS